MRSPEQDQFGAAVHELLAAGSVAAARRWADGDQEPGLDLWGRLAKLGGTGLTVPTRWGGLGASPLDLVVCGREIGHHALPGPAAESLAAVPALLTGLLDTGTASGDEERLGGWLSGLADGELLATVAMPPQVPYAVDAGTAGLILLAESDTVRLATAGTAHRSVDGSRWLHEVQPGAVLARGPAVAGVIGRARLAGTLACAAQLLGAGQSLLEASVRYVTERTQFGRPIGSFQAVKHRLADVAIALEFAGPLLDAAANALAASGPAASGPAASGPADRGLAGPGLADPGSADRGLAGPGLGDPGPARPAAPRDVAAAKVACSDAAYRAARAALQVHGAIGYTEELDLSLWLTKVRALVSAWGSPAEHRATVMAELTGAREA